MNSRGTPRAREALPGLVALALLTLCCGTQAGDGIALEGDEESLSLRVADIPLRSVLESLASRGLVEVIAAPALDAPVDLAVEGASLQSLLHRLLRRHSYVHIARPGADLLWVLPQAGNSVSDGWRVGAVDPLAMLRLDLTDPDPVIREDAVLSAADLEPGVAVDLVRSVTNDPDASVREAAAAVLEDLGATDFDYSDRLNR